MNCGGGVNDGGKGEEEEEEEEEDEVHGRFGLV